MSVNFNNFNNALSTADRLHWGRALAAEARAAGMDTTELEKYLASLNIYGESWDVEDELEELGDPVGLKAYGWYTYQNKHFRHKHLESRPDWKLKYASDMMRYFEEVCGFKPCAHYKRELQLAIASKRAYRRLRQRKLGIRRMRRMGWLNK